MSLLDPVRLVDLARGSGSLPHWLRFAFSSVAPGAVRSSHSDWKTVPALMDLPLPKFADPADRPAHPLRPWIVMSESPASPDLVRLVSAGVVAQKSPPARAYIRPAAVDEPPLDRRPHA